MFKGDQNIDNKMNNKERRCDKSISVFKEILLNGILEMIIIIVMIILVQCNSMM